MSTPPGGPGSPAGTDLAALDWHPVSPRLVTARRLGTALPLAALVVVVATWGVLQPSLPWGLAVVGTLGLVASAWAFTARQVRAISWAERDDDLLVRRGVMVRTLVVVPYGRLQYVDVTAGPLDRWLGIATVQLHTASAGTDAAIPGLPPDDAARLRERLASRGRARLAGL